VRCALCTAAEVARLLETGGFIITGWGQTLAPSLAETRQVEALRAGRGQCAFAVVAAERR